MTKKTAATDLAARIDAAVAERVAQWCALRVAPDDEAAIADVVVAWEAKNAIGRLERGLAQVRSRQADQRRAEQRLDPAWWAAQMASKGWVSVAATWPGVPCPPDLGVIPDPFWSIDPDGIWFTSPTGGRQFVSGPCVSTERGGVAASIDGKWVTTEAAGRSPERAIRAAVDAGLTVARNVTVGDGDWNRHAVPGPTMVRWFTHSIAPDGSLGAAPTARYAHQRPNFDSRPADQKLRDAEALSRLKGIVT